LVIGYTGYAYSNAAGYSWWGEIGAVCGIPATVAVTPSTYAVLVSPGANLPIQGDVAMSGTSMYTVMCPANQVVVGFSGLLTTPGSLQHLHLLSLDCASLDVISPTPGSLSVSIEQAQATPGVGDNSGTAFPDTRCPPGSVVTGTNVVAPDNGTPSAYGVQAFGVQCSAIGLAQ
jgi:hypothetical protein